MAVRTSVRYLVPSCHGRGSLQREVPRPPLRLRTPARALPASRRDRADRMPVTYLDESIEAVAAQGPTVIDALREAARRADRIRNGFRKALARTFKDEPGLEDIGVVLGGSLARREHTHGADCDFLVLVRDMPAHRTIPKVIRAVDTHRADRSLEPPGAQHLFGDFVTASELVTRIGLDADSNVTTTRRLLCLTESTSVFNDDVRDDVVWRMLERYCADYDPENEFWVGHPVRIPHFLTNDVTRYWRTIAVDFGAKQWSSLRADWGLRFAKLVTTRKILFAGTLGSLFLTQTLVAGAASDEERYERLLAHLFEHFSRPPLARLMACHAHLGGAGRTALEDVLRSYDSFIDILERPETRRALKTEPNDDPDSQELRDEVGQIAQMIQSGLEAIFFDDPLFAELTREYGLF